MEVVRALLTDPSGRVGVYLGRENTSPEMWSLPHSAGENFSRTKLLRAIVQMFRVYPASLHSLVEYVRDGGLHKYFHGRLSPMQVMTAKTLFPTEQIARVEFVGPFDIQNREFTHGDGVLVRAWLDCQSRFLLRK